MSVKEIFNNSNFNNSNDINNFVLETNSDSLELKDCDNFFDTCKKHLFTNKNYKEKAPFFNLNKKLFLCFKDKDEIFDANFLNAWNTSNERSDGYEVKIEKHCKIKNENNFFDHYYLIAEPHNSRPNFSKHKPFYSFFYQ